MLILTWFRDMESQDRDLFASLASQPGLDPDLAAKLSAWAAQARKRASMAQRPSGLALPGLKGSLGPGPPPSSCGASAPRVSLTPCTIPGFCPPPGLFPPRLRRISPGKRSNRPERPSSRALSPLLPAWFLSRLLGSLVHPAWGSVLLVFHEWADRFLPYTLLPALAYAVFYSYEETLPRGQSLRRLTAFYAGLISPPRPRRDDPGYGKIPPPIPASSSPSSWLASS